MAGAQARGIPLLAVEQFESVTGEGVRAQVERMSVLLGNRKLMEDSGIDPESLTMEGENTRADGQTVMFLAVDRRLAGLISVADPIKPTTLEAGST